MVKKRAITTLISVVALFCYIIYGYFQEPQTPPVQTIPEATQSARPSASQSGMFVRVVRVVDGDTIEIETGEKVRYIGINTPEIVDSRKPVECFGKEASAKNKELVEGMTVRLEKDVSDKDIYGRLLRYVWVKDAMINELLVRQGFAQVSTYPPDVKYKDRFLYAQQSAQKDKAGLWAAPCNIFK